MKQKSPHDIFQNRDGTFSRLFLLKQTKRTDIWLYLAICYPYFAIS